MSCTYFVLRFSPCGTKSKDMEYTVFTDKKEMMDLFMTQHRFDIDKTKVEIISDENYEGFDPSNFSDDKELKKYKFGSNTSKQLMDVATTYQLIEDAVLEIGEKLTETSRFGYPILRTDIPIIDTINRLMEYIPFAAILDYTALDTYMADLNLPFVETEESHIYEAINNPNSESHGDDSVIKDKLTTELELSTIHDEPIPITIEAYIRCFVDMLKGDI